jgi:hypothetical protein
MDGCVHLSYDKETKVQTSVGWLFDLLKFSKSLNLRVQFFNVFRRKRTPWLGIRTGFMIFQSGVKSLNLFSGLGNHGTRVYIYPTCTQVAKVRTSQHWLFLKALCRTPSSDSRK